MYPTGTTGAKGTTATVIKIDRWRSAG